MIPDVDEPENVKNALSHNFEKIKKMIVRLHH